LTFTFYHGKIVYTRHKIDINVENIDMREERVSFFNADKSAPFYAEMCGVSYCDGSYVIDRKKSGFFVIEYVVSGRGTVIEDGVKSTAAAGDVYFLRAGRAHHYYSDKNDPWVKIWMNFGGELVRSTVESYSLDRETVFHAPELRELFDQMLAVSRSDKPESAVREELMVIFMRICMRLSQTNRDNARECSGVAHRLKESIDALRNYDTTLDELVKPLYCTKSHSIREFKAAFGITPYEYLLTRRFLAAKAMLKSTAMSVSEIAESLSFYDVHYFSDCFKKRFGLTPTEYRKKM
jgi:AraC-like DNA-binding protein/quercetin dioxygenase-like cupin family protein